MTPSNIEDKDVKRLLNRLNATHEPIYLEVTPEPGSQRLDCFIIVRNKVAAKGGRMIMGWQIWQTKHIVEAEAHAVWEDPDENLHELTPKGNGETKILFVEDENLVYHDRQINNIRLTIGNNRLAEDLVRVAEAIHRFDNKGERADLYDLSSVLTPSQINHKAYLMEMQQMISAILSVDGNHKTPCPCGSGQPFKDCHGKHFKQRVSRDV